MPKLSDSMETGTIIAWLKADGDNVAIGDELVEIETDKATIAYAAEDAGALQIAAPVGTTTAVGAPIAQIGEPASTKGSAGLTPPSVPMINGPSAPGANEPAPASSGSNGHQVVTGVRVKASPLARRMAEQLGVALESLVGSGPDGRIVKADLQQQAPAAVAPVEPAVPTATSSAPVTSGSALWLRQQPPVDATGQDRVEPLTRLQRTIATRMIHSRREIPDFTVSVDVDAAPLADLRAQLKAAAQADQPVPSLNDLIIKAVAVALHVRPRANASYSEAGIVIHKCVNVGLAVASQGVLLVPVVRDADLKSVGQIARETRVLAERARDGQITPAELDGGTFTISNLGMYGALECVPVINGSQAAIIGVGAVRREPTVVGDDLVIGQRMRLTIACDHRILYGADAAELLDAVRFALERPLSLAL